MYYTKGLPRSSEFRGNITRLAEEEPLFSALVEYFGRLTEEGIHEGLNWPKPPVSAWDVRRALDLVLKEAGHTEKPLYTFGPLIHNPQVLELLKNRGVEPVESLDEIQGGTVFIRAHGVPPEIKEGIAGRGARVIDATCPHVLRAQVILDKYARRGYRGVISGDPDHPEVVG